MRATNCAAFLWIYAGAKGNWFSREMLKNYNSLQISINVDVWILQYWPHSNVL